jgi:hypothetical protein
LLAEEEIKKLRSVRKRTGKRNAEVGRSTEVFDDGLVGCANCSMELGRVTDALFARWGK